MIFFSNIPSRAVIGVHHVAVALAFALIWTCALPSVAFAYVDPSVMTYTIQALAGVAVALSAVLGVAARRTRKFLMRALDIDETRKRTVDPPVYRLDEHGNPIIAAAANAGWSTAPSAAAAAPATPRAEQKGAHESGATFAAGSAEVAGSDAQQAFPTDADKPRKLRDKLRALYEKLPFDTRPYAPRWRKRFLLAFAASALTIGTIFILSPLEIVGASAGSLVFGLDAIWWIPVLAGAVLILALSLVLSLFKGKLFSLLITLVASVGLCAYVQCLCLNIGVPLANGDTIVWADHAAMMSVCAVAWTAIIVACLLFSRRNLRRTQGVIALASVCLLAVQTVGVLSLVVNPPAQEDASVGEGLTGNVLAQTEAIATEEGLFTVSSKENVIMFVLDTFDTSTMKSLLRTNPDLLDDYTGFTCFTNVTGSMIPTHYAIPALLTGSLPQQGESFSTYVSQRYARGTFLNDLSDAGYSIGLYSDSLGIGEIEGTQAQHDQVIDKTINIHGVSTSTIDVRGTLGALWQIALYREMPWGVKPLFWYYTDQINKAMVHYDASNAAEDTVYIMDDTRFYEQLQNVSLSVEDNDEEYCGAFRFIHLLGAHYPYSYDETGEFIGVDKSTMTKQAQGSLRIVASYLDMLKERGLYDNATIIVTADHGTWRLTNDPLASASCPILLVKPSQDATAAAQCAVVSKAPVSHADILATIRTSIGLSGASAYEGDNTVFDFAAADTDERTRYYYTTTTETRRETGIVEYAITGDAGSISNWELTGVVWDPSQ